MCTLVYPATSWTDLTINLLLDILLLLNVVYINLNKTNKTHVFHFLKLKHLKKKSYILISLNSPFIYLL